MPPDAPAASGAAPGASVPSAAPAASAKSANRAAAVAALGKSPAPVAAGESPAAKVIAPAAPAADDPHAAARAAAEARYMERVKEQGARAKQKLADATAKARREAEEASWSAKVAASKADIERAELAKKDPFQYLESLGVTATELVERGIKRGSPEAAAEARIAAAEAKANELAQWKEDFLKQQVENENRGKAERFAAAVQNEKQAFVSIVASKSEDFPHISGWPDDYLADKAYRAGKEYWDAYQEAPQREHVLRALDKEEGKRKAARQQGSTAGAASAESGASGPTQAKAAGTPKTLTGSHGRSSPRGSSNRASIAEKKAAAVAAMSRATR